MGAEPEHRPRSGVSSESEGRVGDDVIAKAVATSDFEGDEVAVDCGDLTTERHRVVGAMADSQRIDDLRRRVPKDPASIAFAQLAEELRRAGRVPDESAAEARRLASKGEKARGFFRLCRTMPGPS